MAENQEKMGCEPDLSVLDKFNDPFMKTKFGKGVFLAGVLLGELSWELSKSIKCKVEDTPLFKQINFEFMSLRDLKRLIKKIPIISKNYRINSGLINCLAGVVGDLVLEESGELGVDGNFAFTVGFLNAYKYFWGIFNKYLKGKEVSENGV